VFNLVLTDCVLRGTYVLRFTWYVLTVFYLVLTDCVLRGTYVLCFTWYIL